MKTLKQWLDEVPEEYREKAKQEIEDIPQHCLDQTWFNMIQALSWLIGWSGSGDEPSPYHKDWKELRDKTKKQEESRL